MTREEAIEILKDTLYDERTPNNYIQAVRIAREALENQKTGHWIDCAEREPWYKCSECEEKIFGSYYKYCPNCGAKMEGE